MGNLETTVKVFGTGVAGFTIVCLAISGMTEAYNKVVGGDTYSGEGTAFLAARTIAELLCALYVADFVTGLIHMLLDFQTINNDKLRLHAEKTVAGVEEFEKTPLFTEADEHDQYLWNFHSHHEAVYPSSDTQTELFMQLFWYVRIVWPIFFALYYYGYMPEQVSRVWLTALIVGLPSQQTHFLAHARKRDLLKDYPIVEFLQDWHIILHPDSHQQHHEKFNCDFCILNGWANAPMNQIAKFLMYVGALDKEPPSARNRRERAANAHNEEKKAAAAAKTAKAGKSNTAR